MVERSAIILRLIHLGRFKETFVRQGKKTSHNQDTNVLVLFKHYKMLIAGDFKQYLITFSPFLLSYLNLEL